MPAGKAQLPKRFHITWVSVAATAVSTGNGTRNFTVTGKRAVASDMETAALFVLGSLRGVRTASILNVVAAYQSSVAEDIGKYASKEATSMSGEEREILTALEAFTRIQA